MEFRAPVESYSGSVKEVIIGTGSRAVRIGGENTLPLHEFEGKARNKPLVALEINDTAGEGWALQLVEACGDVVSDPHKWAEKCLQLGADLVCLRLDSTDPQGRNAPAAQAAELVRKISASGIPLIVYSSGDEKKDIEVITVVAQACKDANLLIGPAVKENYEAVVKAVMENGHCLIAQTPIDINLEKELNVKLLKSLPAERIVIDPLSSALGYGMEYSFTIMERTKQVGVIFGDMALQMPVIADLGGECWKTNQAKSDGEQGILWEGLTAMSLLLAGANLLVLRHPENCRLVKDAIEGRY